MNLFPCVRCKKPIEGREDMEAENMATSERFIICNECNCINILNEDGTVREATTQEVIKVNSALFKILKKERWN